VGSRGGDWERVKQREMLLEREREMPRERETNREGEKVKQRERDAVGERKRDAEREREREREANKERIRSTVGQRRRSRRRCLVLGRRPVAGGAISGGQNRFPARQGWSDSSCGAVITFGPVIWCFRHSGSTGDGERRCDRGRTRVGHVVAQLSWATLVWLSGSGLGSGVVSSVTRPSLSLDLFISLQ
jgi:hypothetical protein